MLDEDNYVVKKLGNEIKFELAAGMNGRVWIKGSNIKDTILVANMIEQSENLTKEQLDKLLKSILQVH